MGAGSSNADLVLRDAGESSAEQLEDGEAKKLGLPTMTISKGNYYCIEIKNYSANMMIVGKAFEKILSQPDIDSNGFCLEIYAEDTDIVKCLVRKEN